MLDAMSNCDTVGIQLMALRLPETFSLLLDHSVNRLLVQPNGIQLTDHSVTGILMAIRLPDMSNN